MLIRKCVLCKEREQGPYSDICKECEPKIRGVNYYMKPLPCLKCGGPTDIYTSGVQICKKCSTEHAVERIHRVAYGALKEKSNLEGLQQREIGDTINHPSHYGGKDNPYEAIKVIEAWKLGFKLGNVLKYISRAGKKSDDILKDLKKAQFYLNREIEHREKEQSKPIMVNPKTGERNG